MKDAFKNKAREHPLLKPDRPAYINLEILVRDSVSRLPGGAGTKADVALLLRDSQFVVPGCTDQNMQKKVGGALDRLQLEDDPCVKFDSEQKLWIYLHRNRTKEHFRTFYYWKLTYSLLVYSTPKNKTKEKSGSFR